MVIQHAGQWLHQLAQLEQTIREWELLMEKLGVELEREEYLRLLIGRKLLASANDFKEDQKSQSTPSP